MKITSKGQVTIPRHIRKASGFFPGTEVEFVSKGGHVHLRKVRSVPGRGAHVVEKLRGSGSVRMTTEEIMVLMRG